MNRDESAAGIPERLRDVRTRIDEAASAWGRAPDSVVLVAVTKTFPVEDAMEAFRAGARDFGENRVQELVEKMDAFRDAGLGPSWHLIGTLQKNKVKYIVGRVAMIHSVDSVGLLEEISTRSSARGVVTDVLLQVNVSREETKHGFEISKVDDAVSVGLSLPGVRLRGLMTMAPPAEDPETVRPCFEELAGLAARLRGTMPPAAASIFDVLSMGMSSDYRVAIACGATHVRLGTAIFGGRTPKN